MTSASEESYEYVRQLTRALQKASVPHLVGTDASTIGLFPGWSVHLEMKEMVEAELSPYQALSAATRTGGVFIRSEINDRIRVGMVKSGFVANLVLLNRNPLDNIEHTKEIEGVFIQGRWLTIDQLNQRSGQAIFQYSAAVFPPCRHDSRSLLMRPCRNGLPRYW